MKNKLQLRQFVLWTVALVAGGILGAFNVGWLNRFFDFVATGYTRMFQFVAVPTVALAVMTALANLGHGDTGKIFRKTFTFTLLTSFAAAFVGLGLYLLIAPENLPVDVVTAGAANATVQKLSAEPLTVYGHILSAIPNNMVSPFLSGNVLSIIIIAAAFGVTFAVAGKGENAQHLLKTLVGLQEMLFALIRGLIRILPVGIVAFAAQLSAQIEAGVVFGSLGKYVAVVLLGNLLQFFVVLPLFLACRGINPFRVMRQMSPALLMALFTKSSAATLPVTVATAEANMGARSRVARFVLPICCTINMNGCAAFILVTSLFVMQNGGMALTLPTMLVWCVIAVLCAIGNAGVPMGCYFLTLSLMAGVGGPLGILGVILPLYTIIDMIETAENVWSDCCICAIVNKDLPND